MAASVSPSIPRVTRNVNGPNGNGTMYDIPGPNTIPAVVCLGRSVPGISPGGHKIARAVTNCAIRLAGSEAANLDGRSLSMI